VNAVTHDLSDWKVGSEDRISTFFYDVFGYEQGTDPPASQIKTDESQNGGSTNDCNDGEEGTSDQGGDDVEVQQQQKGIKAKGDAKDKEGKASTTSPDEPFDFEEYSLNHTNVDYVLDAHSSVIIVILIWLVRPEYFVSSNVICCATLTQRG